MIQVWHFRLPPITSDYYFPPTQVHPIFHPILRTVGQWDASFSLKALSNLSLTYLTLYPVVPLMVVCSYIRCIMLLNKTCVTKTWCGSLKDRKQYTHKYNGLFHQVKSGMITRNHTSLWYQTWSTRSVNLSPKCQYNNHWSNKWVQGQIFRTMLNLWKCLSKRPRIKEKTCFRLIRLHLAVNMTFFFQI